MEFKVLELFSGIGGMHQAFQYAMLPGKVVAAYDINTVANLVYTHSYPGTPVKNNNIQCLDAATIKKLKVNMIVMSPPCQPHTRQGNQLDELDTRSDALKHICQILPECVGIRYVLMENVKGFDKSQARQTFLSALKAAGFHVCEFILSPRQFGVPNTRHRYYCLARKDPIFDLEANRILEQIPRKVDSPFVDVKSIEEFLKLEEGDSDEFLVKDKDLIKRVGLMDIVTADDTNTMCFTKAYTHYMEGTGSIFTPLKRNEIDQIFLQIKNLEESTNNQDESEKLKLLQSLHLRYFSPKEVSRLMCFPENFDFPVQLTKRQKYRLLGNSINVQVVGELIKILCN